MVNTNNTTATIELRHTNTNTNTNELTQKTRKRMVKLLFFFLLDATFLSFMIVKIKFVDFFLLFFCI